MKIQFASRFRKVAALIAITLTGIISMAVPASLKEPVAEMHAGSSPSISTQQGKGDPKPRLHNCGYSVTPSNALPSSGGTGTATVTVVEAHTCGWTATTNSDSKWITITSDSSGSYSKVVTYSVAANTSPNPRTGKIIISGDAFIPSDPKIISEHTVTQAGFSCAYSISPTNQSLSATAGTGSFTVTTTSGCPVTPTPSDDWIKILSESGTITRSISFSVTANPEASVRNGRITILGAGQSGIFNITQAGSCTYAISPANQSFTSTAGTGSVTVTTTSGCSWAATSNNVDWLSVTSSGTGTGNGAVSFSVTANTSTTMSRTGTLIIGGKTFTVTQAAAPCTYSISPTSQSFISTGGTGSVIVTTESGCSWTPTSNQPWVVITSVGSSTGNGVVNYRVDANTGTGSRPATVTIAGRTFTVTQEPPLTSLSDNFEGTAAAYDETKWNLVGNVGSLTEGSHHSDSEVSARQGSGTMNIQPLANADHSSYNGCQSKSLLNLTGQSASIRIAQAATGGARTIFAVGNDTNNWFRFLITSSSSAASSVNGGGLKGDGDIHPSDESGSGLILFDSKVNGVQSPATSITSTPTAQGLHLRSRHDPQSNRMVLETSRDGITWTIQGTFPLPAGGVAAMKAELIAGTSTPVPAPGEAKFDDFRLGASTGVSVPNATAPGAPTGLTATTVSSTQINLTWTDNSTDETGFKIERKQGESGVYAQIATVGAGATTYSNSGLSAQTQYYYRVRATNAVGDSTPSGEASATTSGSTTTPPPTPTPVVTPTPTTPPPPPTTPPPTTPPPTTTSVQFSAASVSVGEADERATLLVTRTGDVSRTASIEYQTADASELVRCDTVTGRASNRCDYATSLDTLSFAVGERQKTITIPITNDTFVEGNEVFSVALANVQGASLGAERSVTLTIIDNDTAAAAGVSNPLDTASFFVRQQYLDFLSREPEQDGMRAWMGVLERCGGGFAGSDVECDRIHVSQSFFRSEEFQLKGYYVYRFYKATLGRAPKYSEIIPEMRRVSGETDAEVFARRDQYARTWVERDEFKGLYGSMNNADFVGRLLQTAGVSQVTPPAAGAAAGMERATLVGLLESGGRSRAEVVRLVVESREVDAREYNGAFVAMQYFGYLRRDPEEEGYRAWLRVIDANPEDRRTMVNGFMNSVEYRLRFGRP